MSNFTIKVLTPIHIGSNENKNLSSISDFIIDDGFVKIIDRKKFEKLFEENPQFMEDYINEVNYHSGKSYDLKQFLKTYKVNLQDIITDIQIPLYGKLDGKIINTFISENGKKYIPGSSIKGAIRNALAFEYLKNHKSLLEELLGKSFDNKFKPNFNRGDRQIFGKSPFNDVLKYLQVSDSQYFTEYSTAIQQCYSFHLKKKNLTVPINFECILPDSVTDLRINIKKPSQKQKDDFWENALSISEIIKAINDFSLEFVKRELTELKDIEDLNSTVKFYRNLKNTIENSKNQSAYLCLGKGTTIFGKTMLLTLEEKALSDLKLKMKDTKVSRNYGWKFVNGKGKQASGKFPVTRIVYPVNNSFQAGMGWIKMEMKL